MSGRRAALVVGMKGQGKSCLVERALDRHQQDSGELSLVVLQGVLDEIQLLDSFRTEAIRLGDDAAERCSTTQPGQRLWKLVVPWQTWSPKPPPRIS
jgi:GTPase SAR1 family protein